METKVEVPKAEILEVRGGKRQPGEGRQRLLNFPLSCAEMLLCISPSHSTAAPKEIGGSWNELGSEQKASQELSAPHLPL